MSLPQWFRYLFLLLLGCSLLFIAYKIKKEQEADAYSQQHSPLINMPVVRRVKGWGTMRVPNKIYVSYHGKRYVLPCSNQYFKQTATLDSLFVHYDERRDRAVLAEGSSTASYGPLILLVLGGLISVSSTLVHLYRTVMKNRPSRLRQDLTNN